MIFFFTRIIDFSIEKVYFTLKSEPSSYQLLWHWKINTDGYDTKVPFVELDLDVLMNFVSNEQLAKFKYFSSREIHISPGTRVEIRIEWRICSLFVYSQFSEVEKGLYCFHDLVIFFIFLSLLELFYRNQSLTRKQLNSLI